MCVARNPVCLPKIQCGSWMVLTCKAFTLFNQTAAAKGRSPLQQLCLLHYRHSLMYAATKGSFEWPWTGRQLSAAAVHSGGGGRVQGKLCCWWRSDPTLCCPRRLCSTRDLPIHPYWIIVFANCLKAARSDPVSALLWNTHKLSGQGC